MSAFQNSSQCESFARQQFCGNNCPFYLSKWLWSHRAPCAAMSRKWSLEWNRTFLYRWVHIHCVYVCVLVGPANYKRFVNVFPQSGTCSWSVKSYLTTRIFVPNNQCPPLSSANNNRCPLPLKVPNKMLASTASATLSHYPSWKTSWLLKGLVYYSALWILCQTFQVVFPSQTLMNALLTTMIAMAMRLVQILTAVTSVNATGHLPVMAETAQVSACKIGVKQLKPP